MLITGFVPPIVGYVTKSDGSKWFSPSVSTPVTHGFININLTGLTDLVAYNIAIANGKASSTQLTSSHITSTSLNTAISTVNSQIAPQIVEAGLDPASFNPITMPLVTNGLGQDQLLDSLAITNSPDGPTTFVPLSPDQRIFAKFQLLPNSSNALSWNLPVNTAPISGTHYLQNTSYSIAKSPAPNKTQPEIGSSWVNLSKTLALPNPQIPQRYLIGGAIVVGRSPTIDQISYVGNDVRVDNLATDGTTIVESFTVNGFSITPLTGTVVSAPIDLKQYFGALFSNTGLLSANTTWASGSNYRKHSSTRIHDVYIAFDGPAAQTSTGTDILPTPGIPPGTSLVTAMTSGIGSISDNKTYNLSNGTITNVNGFPIYIGNEARPNRTPTQYRTYFALNGSIYTGALIRAGTVSPSSIRLNGPAANSIQAAFNY